MSLVQLKTELRQELKLTPQLLQSMEVLQMTSQELLEYISRQTEENPLLDQSDTPERAYEELRQQASWIDGGVGRATFAHEDAALADKLGRHPLDCPQPRPGSWRLGERLYLEQAEQFDWPDLEAPERGTRFCLGLRDQIAVLADGTAVPCCLDHEGDIPLGNLLEQELDEILSSPRARAVCDGFSQGKPSEALCRRCGFAARFG